MPYRVRGLPFGVILMVEWGFLRSEETKSDEKKR